MSGSSVGPTASVSMLKPRRLKRPAIRANTPGRFSTMIESTCLRPVSAPEAACRSSSLIRSGVPASIGLSLRDGLRAANHVPGGGAGGGPLGAVLRLGQPPVDPDRALRLARVPPPAL